MKTGKSPYYLKILIVSLALGQLVYGKGNSSSQHGDRTNTIRYHEILPEIHLESATEKDNRLRCSIKAFGSVFSLALESNERLVANLPHSQRRKLFDACKLFRGTIKGVPESWVRLCKTGKKWSGMLWDGQELYILDPVRSIRHILKPRPHSHTSGTAIYKLSDVVRQRGKACGVDQSAAVSQPAADYQSLVDELRGLISLEAEGASLNLDMAVVTDPLFSETQEGTFGTPTSAAVAARINVVDGIYSEQVGVQISLVDIVELANNGPLTSTSPNTLLNQFSNFMGSSGIDNPGITHLFTGRNLNGSVIGIAFLGTLCDQDNGVGVDEIRGDGTSGALLVAHELGHNFGAPHDNQGGSPCATTPGTFIMNPSLNGSDQFSQCSINQMQPTINNASCLTDIDANQPPMITITSPENGAFVSVNTQVDLVGSATDPEDGDLGVAISWSSDLDGALGTGGSISVILSEGTHQITASITDSGGLGDLGSIIISVIDDGDGVVLIESNFDADEEEFVFVDDAFGGTSEPAFADGNHLPNGGFTGGALQVMLGNINNATILGMSGGWQQTIVLDSNQDISMTFRYNLTQASNYEADEFSQALLAVDGSLVVVDGNDFLAQITGNGNGGPAQTTGWVPMHVNLGTFSAGTHTITIGAFNNKKTFNDESTELLIDDVTIRGESGPPPPTPGIIIESHFDADEENFAFEEDTFRSTNNPGFSTGNHLPTGGFNGGGLQVTLGNINNTNILGMSGGWSQSFTLDEPQQVSVSLRYNLTQASDYETDEFSEALVSLDGNLVSTEPDGVLARITGDGNGGPAQTTGWVSVTLDLGVLTANEPHTLTIGAFNNKKTFFNESTDLRIDDVIVSGEPTSLPTVIFENHFDSDEEDFVFNDDAFLDTNEPDFADGSYLVNGGFTGGALQVELGNINNAVILGISGGWSRSFTLDASQEVTLSFRYNLTQSANYESDEFSEALFALNGILIGSDEDDALARITGNGNGGPAQTTGWVLVNLNLGTLSGTHTITLGGFNNKKTFNDESTEILIDDVILKGI